MLAVGGALVLDEELRHFVENHATETTRSLARTFEPFGAEYAWGALGAFFLSGRFLKSEKAAAVAEDGFVSSLIAAGAITPILKATVGRQRPSQTEGTFALSEGGTSFPSGHATQAFALASVIASHYDSPWVKIASYGVAGLVGLARMEDKAHYASDVLAGALIGIVVGKTVVRLHDAERFSISAAPSVNTASPGVALTFRIGLDDVLRLFRDD
jgi:membrane-associated phospholipid phosphatase